MDRLSFKNGNMLRKDSSIHDDNQITHQQPICMMLLVENDYSRAYHCHSIIITAVGHIIKKIIFPRFQYRLLIS